MSILTQINNLKIMLKNIDAGIPSLPKELQTIIEKDSKTLRDLVNTMGGAIEKYYKDQRNLKKMSQDLLNEMNESDIYKGLTARQKQAIVEKIISDADLVLLNAEDLRLFVRDKLQTEDDDDNLIKKAYSKKDIIHLGDAVAPHGSSEVVKYDAGFKILRDMMKTPMGRKDAITHGIKRLLSNATTVQYYLMLYYGIK